MNRIVMVAIARPSFALPVQFSSFCRRLDKTDESSQMRSRLAEFISAYFTLRSAANADIAADCWLWEINAIATQHIEGQCVVNRRITRPRLDQMQTSPCSHDEAIQLFGVLEENTNVAERVKALIRLCSLNDSKLTKEANQKLIRIVRNEDSASPVFLFALEALYQLNQRPSVNGQLFNKTTGCCIAIWIG